MPRYISANPKKKIPTFTLGELIDYLEESWVKAVTIILWAYGIRIGEVEALRRYDFTIRDGMIWMDAPPEKNKNNPDRVLPLSLDTPFFPILVDYLNSLGDGDVIMPMSRQTYWRRLKAVDPELSAHVFRHYRATQIALTKPHEYELQNWLGHSDTRMAHKYIHGSGVFAIDLGKRMRVK